MVDTVIMPKLGFDMAEGTLVRWVIAEGEMVSKGIILAEIETDKATVEVESAYSGILRRQLIPPGTVVPVGTPIAIITDVNEEYAPDQQAEPSRDVAPQQIASMGSPAVKDISIGGELPTGILQRVKASPLARKMASELGIDIKSIHGTGPEGRIVKKDIETFIAAASEPSKLPEIGLAAKEAPVPAAVQPGTTDLVVPLNRLRATIGRRMSQSKQHAPHFYITYEYEMDKLMELRTQLNDLLPEEEKISVNDFIVKSVAIALQQFPNLNASFNNDSVVQHRQVNIGVAVALEGGLLTIVCKDVVSKSLRQIASEVRSMVERARQGKVRPEDIEGSTFTVSNLGMYGVENFTAIINPPESAILAVAKVREIPVIKDTEVCSGLRMKATLSVDHRVSDGAEAARFMQYLASILQETLRLVVDI